MIVDSVLLSYTPNQLRDSIPCSTHNITSLKLQPHCTTKNRGDDKPKAMTRPHVEMTSGSSGSIQRHVVLQQQQGEIIQRLRTPHGQGASIWIENIQLSSLEEQSQRVYLMGPDIYNTVVWLTRRTLGCCELYSIIYSSHLWKLDQEKAVSWKDPHIKVEEKFISTYAQIKTWINKAMMPSKVHNSLETDFKDIEVMAYKIKNS